MRTYLIDNVRKHAPKIFHISPEAECYSSDYDRSATQAFVDLLKSPKKPQETYPVYPRVLFTNYKVINKERFGSTAILNVRNFHPTKHSFLTTASLDLEDDPSWTKLPQLHQSSEVRSKGIRPSVGIERHYPGLHRNGHRSCKIFLYFLVTSHQTDHPYSSPVRHFARSFVCGEGCDLKNPLP